MSNTLPPIPRVPVDFMNRVHDEEAEMLTRLQQQMNNRWTALTLLSTSCCNT